MPFSDDVSDLFGSGGVAYVTSTDEEVWHKRRQIRGFLLARFRAAAANPKRVRSESRAPFQSRPDQRHLPALNVFTIDETSLRGTKMDMTRELQLAVDILAEGTGECLIDDLDPKVRQECPCIGCKLDQYALVVEGLLEIERPDTEAMRNLVEDIVLTSTTKTLEEQGDKRFGSVRLLFLVTYTTDTTGEFWPD